jgi:hypothetical protein
MKLFAFVLFLMGAYAVADTVIMYDDGSTYTVKPSEEVFVSNKRLWTVTGDFRRGVFHTVEVSPNDKRDFVEVIDADDYDPETGKIYCDAVPGYPFTFGGGTDCVDRPSEETQECDGFTFGGGDC